MNSGGLRKRQSSTGRFPVLPSIARRAATGLCSKQARCLFYLSLDSRTAAFISISVRLMRAREQVASIKAACVDMSQPFLSSLKSNFPGWQGKVVHDRFHLVQHMNKAVNDTRKIEHAELSRKKDVRLKGTRQLWL